MQTGEPRTLEMSREEWVADAARYIRAAYDGREMIPRDHPVYAWSPEAASIGRELAAAVRQLLTARLAETDGRDAASLRERRLVLGRYARTGQWDEAARVIRYSLDHELAEVESPGGTLAHRLWTLEKLVRARASAIRTLGEQLVHGAVARETARRATDAAWQEELQRRKHVRKFTAVAGTWAPGAPAS